MERSPVALVTGGNRGIGLEVARQLAERGYVVYVGSRRKIDGDRAAKNLRKGNPAWCVESLVLDVTKETTLRRAIAAIARRHGRLDALVNNAGAFLDDVSTRRGYERGSALFARVETIRKSMEVNAYGAFRLCQLALPLMMKRKAGRIVNVSSGMGQLTEMNGGRPGYRISKTALNAVTRIFADEMKPHGILVNSACPGWVRTRMGGKEAELSPSEGARTIVWLATLSKSGPTGGFYREKKKLAW